MNVHRSELRALSVGHARSAVRRAGAAAVRSARGRDTAPVTAREIPLTLSRETSFHEDTADPATVEGMLEYLVAARAAPRASWPCRRTVAVRLRYSDGEGDEQARRWRCPRRWTRRLALALVLLRRLFTRRVSLHARGRDVVGFTREAGEQGALFDEREAGRRAALCATRSTACAPTGAATARSCGPRWH